MSAAVATGTKFSGADWLERVTKKPLSDFGREVADVIGQVWAGIYHMQPEVMHKRADWQHPDRIEIVTYGQLSTFDDSLLTALVVLCHDRAIRLSISGASSRHLRLTFYRRSRDGEYTSEIHPRLEVAVERIRRHCGLSVV